MTNPYSQFGYAKNPYEAFGYEGKPKSALVKPQMPDVAAADKTADATSVSDFLSKGESWEEMGKRALGIGENMAAMTLGFAKAVPATLTGLATAIINKNPDDYAKAFKVAQIALTTQDQPHTDTGKEISRSLQTWMNKYSGVVDKYLVDPNLENKNILMATIGKTSGEAMPYLLPFLMGRMKGTPETEMPPKPGTMPPGAPPPGTPPPGAPPIEGELVPKEHIISPKVLPHPAIEGEAVRIEEGVPKTLPPPAAPTPVEGENIIMEDPYKAGQLPRIYETTPDKVGQIPEGSAISFGNVEKGGAGVSLTRNTVPGEGPYRLTEWQDGAPIKHAAYPDYQSALTDFQNHLSRPDANGIVPDRAQVVETPDDALHAKIANSFPPNQRGMIDPDVFREGFSKLIELLDKGIGAYRESPIVKGIYQTTEPLEAVSAEAAGIIKMHSNALSVADYTRDLTHKQLDQIPKETREQMGRSVENPQEGRELTPIQQHLTQSIVQKNEALSELAMRLGILKNVHKPYFPHLVEEYMKRPDWAKGFKKAEYLKTTLGAAKARKYGGTVTEAEEESGLKRVHDIKALVDINHDLEKSIIGRNLVNTIRDHINPIEADKLGYPGEQIPGGVPLNIPGAVETQYFTRRWINYNGSKLPVQDGIVLVGDQRIPVDMSAGKAIIEGKPHNVQSIPDHRIKQIYTTPEIANAVEAAFKANSPGLIMHALLGLKSLSLRAIMVFPTFHHMTILSKAVPAMPVAGFGPKLWWTPERLYGKDLWNIIPNPQKQVLRTWVGGYVAGEYIRKIPGAVEEAINDNYTLPKDKGYMIDTYGAENIPVKTWKQRVLNNLYPGLGDKLEKGNRVLEYDALWRQVGNIGLTMHKMLKIQGTERAIKDFTRTNGRPPTETEVSELENAAGKQAGYVASLLTSMFSRPEFGAGYRNFLNLTLFSRSNLFSAGRLLKYGIGIMPKWLQYQSAALNSVVGRGAAFRAGIGAAGFIILKDMALLYGLWSIGNYLTTKELNIPDKNGKLGGHFSWQNEKGKEEYIAVGKREDGSVIYMNTPIRATRDTFNMIMNPQVILKDKPSTLIKLAEGVATGKDWRGRDIPIRGDSLGQHALEWATWSAKTLAGYENLMGTVNPDARHTYWYWRAMGFQFAEGDPAGPAGNSLRQLSMKVEARKQVWLDQAKDLRREGKVEDGVQLLKERGMYSEIGNYILGARDPKAALLLHTKWPDLYQYLTPEEKAQLKELQLQK